MAPVAYCAVAARSCASIQTIRSGRTATASCSRRATPRCCCYSLLHLTRRARPSTPSTRSLGDSSVTLDDIKTLPPARHEVPRPPGVPLDARHRDDDRPARAGRRDQRSAWRSPRAGCAAHLQPAGLRAVRLRRLRDRRRRLHDGGRLGEAASLAGHLRALEPVLDLRQQQRSRSRATPTSPSPRTSPRGSSAYGWNVTRGRRRQRPRDAGSAPSHASRREHERPTLIIVDSHIGYGSPKQDTHAAHGEPLGEEEIKPTKRIYGWPEDAKFLVPDGVLRALRRPASARAARDCARAWEATVRAVPRRVSRARRPDRSGCSAASCRRLGQGPRRRSRPTRRASRAATSSGKVLNALAQERPVADRRLGRPRAVDEDAAHVRRRRRLRSATSCAGATSTSASASTRMARDR